MCRGCEGWTHEDLYMCRLCRQHANTREGIVHRNMNGVVLCRNNEVARRFVENDKKDGIDTRLSNEGGAEAVRHGACPGTRIERHPDYNDDGSRVDDLLDKIFDYRFLLTLAAVVLIVALVELMFGEKHTQM
jgi:hypothetical protein